MKVGKYKVLQCSFKTLSQIAREAVANILHYKVSSVNALISTPSGGKNTGAKTS